MVSTHLEAKITFAANLEADTFIYIGVYWRTGLILYSSLHSTLSRRPDTPQQAHTPVTSHTSGNCITSLLFRIDNCLIGSLFKTLKWAATAILQALYAKPK